MHLRWGIGFDCTAEGFGKRQRAGRAGLCARHAEEVYSSSESSGKRFPITYGIMVQDGERDKVDENEANVSGFPDCL